MEKQKKASLLDMVQGGVKERVEIEFAKVIDNILNKNAFIAGDCNRGAFMVYMK